MKFKSVMRIIRHGLLISLKVASGLIYGSLMILVFSLLYFLLTQNGATLLLKLGAQIAPSTLSVQRVEGRLYDQLSLYGVEVNLPSGKVTADKITLDWRLPRLLIGQLSIRELVLVNTRIELFATAGKESPSADAGLDLSWLEHIRIRWPFTLVLEKFDASNTEVMIGESRYLIEQFQMGTALTDGRLVFRTDELQAIGAGIEGTIQIVGDQEGKLRLDGSVNWSYSGAPWPLAGQLQVNGDFRQLNLVHSLTQPVAIKSEIEMKLVGKLPELKSSHHWAELCWPDLFNEVCLRQGDLDFEFKDDSYVANLKTRVKSPGNHPFPLLDSSDISVEISSKGRVDLEHTAIKATAAYRLDAGVAGPWQTWQGTLTLDGEPTKLAAEMHLSQPAVVMLEATAQQHQSMWKAQGKLGLSDFNPGVVVPNAAGLVSADIGFKGETGDNSFAVEIDLKRLTGHLLNEPIFGSGGFSIKKDLWVANNFSLKLRGMEIALSGALDPTATGKIVLAVNVPDLQLYAPDLSGQALINAQITGSLAKPKVTLDGRIQSLKTPVGEWQEVYLQAGGTLADHHAELALTGEPGGKLKLNGQWQDGKWKGELQALQIASKQAGEWSLAAPVEIQWSPKQWKTESLCLVASKNRVCAQGIGTADLLEGKLSVNWEDFSSLKPFLPESLRLSTPLMATASIRFASTEGLSGTLQASTREGYIRWFTAENGRLKLPVRLHNLEVKFSSTQLEGIYDLRLATEDVAQGKFLLTAPSETPFKYDTLAGDIRGGLARFDWLQFFVPQIENMQGEMIWDVAVEGTPIAPRLRGKIMYQNGRLSLPEFGQIDLPLTLDINLNGSQLALLARVESAERGMLAVKGEASFPTLTAWKAQGQLTGNDFLVVDTAEYRARITPNLKFSAKPGSVTVKGEISIPDAQINFRGLPTGGVTISNDVVVIRANQPPTARNILIADVTVKTGDHVYFKGMGLDGRVTGSVRYLRRASGLQEIFGDLGIRDGIYRAFGYNLEIARGTIIFAGSPANPGLDISAERRLLSGEKIPVLISGSLQEPILTLPQSSDQSQGDSFSKLLTGRNVGDGASGQNIVSDQVTMMGVGLAENVTQGFAQSLGFDSGGLRSDGGLESTSLYLGKQVTERLFVGYGIGLVTPEQTVNLRLTLDKNWSVEATSGREGGVDLIYNFETTAETTRPQEIKGSGVDAEESTTEPEYEYSSQEPRLSK